MVWGPQQKRPWTHQVVVSMCLQQLPPRELGPRGRTPCYLILLPRWAHLCLRSVLHWTHAALSWVLTAAILWMHFLGALPGPRASGQERALGPGAE